MGNILITGILGQDGSFLAEQLLNKDNNIIGLVRRSSTPNFVNIKQIINDRRLKLVEGDLTDYLSINKIFQSYKIDEVYNMAAQSHVHTSFDQPQYTTNTNYLGVMYILDNIQRYSPKTKYYNSSSSEMFGNNVGDIFTSPDGKVIVHQNENTPFAPQSPYGISKVAAHYLCQLYRKNYGLFICCGILFNHSSCRRGINFVSRKITRYVAELSVKKTAEKLHLGNLDASRDWGDAEIYTQVIQLIMSQPQADDYVIGTGKSHTVREFCEKAFNYIGKDYSNYVVVDQLLFRPAEVNYLRADTTKAKEKLGWSYKFTLDDLVKKMIDYDIKLLESQ